MDDEGVYTLNISNDFGSESCSADVFIEFEMPTFTKPLQDVTVTVDSDVTLECTVKGLPVPETTWLINDKPITESDKYHLTRHENTATLEVKQVKPEDATVLYECKAYNPAGQALTSANINIQGRTNL